MRFHLGKLLVPATVLVALFVFAGRAQAQYGGYCPDTCVAYESCDTPCEKCVIEGYDYCQSSRESTCGQGGGQCGGCAVTNRWTEDEHNKYGPQDGGAPHCLGRQYWYGSTNWSQYQRYITQVIHITYETTTCNGVSTTQEVSRTGELGECYQLVDPDCASNQTHEPSPDVHGNECYW
jgi:hypothetical protein